MKRVILAVLVLAVATAPLSPGLSPSWAGDDAKGKKPKKANPEAMFKKLDANNDGKVSKEEFARFTANNPKAQANPAAAEKRFSKLDANVDGSLSLEEFKKLGERKPGERKKADK